MFHSAEAVIDLPGIAVIGNQSAGKSSLVEAVGAVRKCKILSVVPSLTIHEDISPEKRQYLHKVQSFIQNLRHHIYLRLRDRCPMECRLKQSTKAWSCQIRLRRKRDTDLDGLSSALTVGKKNAREESFGPLLTNKLELELMIRRAQLAILNPSLPVSRFVEMTEQEIDEGFVGNDGQLQFSQDVVCLDISSPDVTNLSFIDLPG